MLDVSYISVDGVRSAVHDTRPGTKSDAVVFVHGNPGPMDDFESLIPAAGELGRVVALDLPGFGRADRPKRFEFSVAGYAQHLAGVLDQLGVERAHLVLHDFGGPWGLEWAARDPDRVASAVLINTGVLIDYSWHYLARIWRTPVLGELFQATTTRNGLRTALRHGNPRGLPRAFVDRMYDQTDAGTKRAILQLYRSTPDPSAVGRRHADALRPFDIPALVVWGAHDPYIPVRQAEHQREAFPSAAIEVLPDSGHWPFADDPEAVGRVVEPFLRSVVGSEREALLA
jgi:pimeloyl-ACP methyl ester carboxylesterase